MSMTSLAILLHSSKTMHSVPNAHVLRKPLLYNKAQELGSYLKTLSTEQIERSMHISPSLAVKTQALIQQWNTEEEGQTCAIDSFIGDIYSGLRAHELSEKDREYADQTLRILSGLYGILRPFDGVYPYRLEMAYAFADSRYASLYKFWGTAIADRLPPKGYIINVSSVEYMRVITPFIESSRIITPHFLTVHPTTKIPTFTAVHAKIARGAFARWLITSRITDPTRFNEFTELGYHFNEELSTPSAPTFICQTFGGIGLSIRLR
jgi:cytoplasmic iron level regulating protein YaaA (DUF328/UPF0246 family)